MRKTTILHVGIKNWPYDSAYADANLTGIRGGGMNKYCDTLINAFPQNIETFILTQRLRGQERYEKKENVNIFRIFTFGNRATRQIFTNIFSLFYAYKLCKRKKIDLIHGHMAIGIFTAYLIGRMLKIKVIGTPYSFISNNKNLQFGLIARFIERNFYEKIEKIVFETEENKQKAFEVSKLKFSNSIVINTGIEVPTLKNKKKSTDTINIFYIGRIVKIKALDKLILSLTHLEDKVKNKIHIDIIGEGELLESLMKLTNEKQLDQYISLHGFVNNKYTFIEQSDIFILPSETEGLSISLLEAMSYGKACIVNDFGVPFSDEEVFVMQDNKPQTIANAITYFVNNNLMIHSYGDNAKLRIENDFSVAAFSGKYLQVYNELITQK